MNEFSFDARWTVTLAVDEVPDRPMPYSSVNASYRPEMIRANFTLNVSDDLNGVTLPALVRSSGQKDIRLHTVDIIGSRLKKDGTPGAHAVKETLWRLQEYPRWVRELLSPVLDKLQGD